MIYITLLSLYMNHQNTLKLFQLKKVAHRLPNPFRYINMQIVIFNSAPDEPAVFQTAQHLRNF